MLYYLWVSNSFYHAFKIIFLWCWQYTSSSKYLKSHRNILWDFSCYQGQPKRSMRQRIYKWTISNYNNYMLHQKHFRNIIKEGTALNITFTLNYDIDMGPIQAHPADIVHPINQNFYFSPYMFVLTFGLKLMLTSLKHGGYLARVRLSNLEISIPISNLSHIFRFMIFYLTISL